MGLRIAEFTLHHGYVTIYFLHYQIGEHLCLFHFENISSKPAVHIHTQVAIGLFLWLLSEWLRMGQ